MVDWFNLKTFSFAWALLKNYKVYKRKGFEKRTALQGEIDLTPIQDLFELLKVYFEKLC